MDPPRGGACRKAKTHHSHGRCEDRLDTKRFMYPLRQGVGFGTSHFGGCRGVIGPIPSTALHERDPYAVVHPWPFYGPRARQTSGNDNIDGPRGERDASDEPPVGLAARYPGAPTGGYEMNFWVARCLARRLSGEAARFGGVSRRRPITAAAKSPLCDARGGSGRANRAAVAWMALLAVMRYTCGQRGDVWHNHRADAAARHDHDT